MIMRTHPYVIFVALDFRLDSFTWPVIMTYDLR